MSDTKLVAPPTPVVPVDAQPPTPTVVPLRVEEHDWLMVWWVDPRDMSKPASPRLIVNHPATDLWIASREAVPEGVRQWTARSLACHLFPTIYLQRDLAEAFRAEIVAQDTLDDGGLELLPLGRQRTNDKFWEPVWRSPGEDGGIIPTGEVLVLSAAMRQAVEWVLNQTRKYHIAHGSHRCEGLATVEQMAAWLNDAAEFGYSKDTTGLTQAVVPTKPKRKRRPTSPEAKRAEAYRDVALKHQRTHDGHGPKSKAALRDGVRRRPWALAGMDAAMNAEIAQLFPDLGPGAEPGDLWRDPATGEFHAAED